MNKKDHIFKEIFDKSPIGIFCYDKKGNLIDANPTALEIAGVDSLDDFKKVNLFDNPNISSRKTELLEKGLIKFQSQLNYDDIKSKGIYTPTKSGIAFIEWSISVTDSGFLVQIQDINGQVQTEYTLNKDEEVYGKLFENAKDAFQIVELIYNKEGNVHDFRYLKTNNAFEHQSGLKSSEITGKTIKRILPNVEPHWFEMYDKAAKEGKPLHDENYNQDTNRWYDMLYIPYSKNKVGVIFRDVTKHKNAENALRESEEKLRTIFENSQDGINLLNLKTGKYVFMSPAQVELTGFTAEEMNNFSAEEGYERTHPDDREITINQQKKVVAGDDISKPVEYRWKVKNGEYRWFSDNRKLIRDENGQPVALVGVSRDITERKKAEEELKRHAALLDISYEAIFSWSFEDGILSWNQGAERIYGYNKEESIGRISHELLKTKYPHGFNDFIEKLIKGDMWTGELVHTTKNDKKLIIESRQQLIQDTLGRIIVIETNRDITNRKKVENENKRLIKELQKFTEELETSNEEMHSTTKELHTANEELKQSQKLMQDMINGYPSIIFVKDLEGRFININNKLEDLLGVSNEELIGKTDYDIFPTEEAEYYRAHDKKVLEKGKAIPIEEEADLADGHHIFLANKFPIYDIDGNPYGVGSISTDITEIKNYEMQINRQNRLLDGINKVFQESLTCETVEDVVEKCLEVAEGLTESEFSFIGEVNEKGRLDDRAISPSGWDACTANPEKSLELLSNMEIVSYWGRTVKEGKSQIVNDPDSDPDKRGIPEGHPPIKSFLGVPLKQGSKTIGLIALANKEGGYTEEDKDNIETLSVAFVEALKRKQTEIELKYTLDHLEEQVEERTIELEEAYQTLKEKEIKYRSLYENAPVGIFHSTLDGKYIDVNPELARLLGYDSPEDLVSTANKSSIADVIYANKDLRPGFLESALKADAWFKTENLYRRKDGEIIIGDLSFRGFGRDKNGNPLLEGFMTDITDRKKSEEQLREIIGELERSNKELQSFAYITSHDLQEPLRTIASYAQLIERRYKGKLDSDADEFIEFMVDGSRRMKSMIQGLLDYSRVGTRGHEFTEFDAEDALNYALSNLGTAISEVDAEITDDELPVIFADKDQIVRVFQNLIGNAIKFSSDGVQPKIHISSHKKDSEYVFSVSDNGIGLEEQYSDQIFEVFKRLHSIGEYQGTGIGLAIVKRIIDRHGGRVWVESEPCVGSTFYFTIPTEKN